MFSAFLSDQQGSVGKLANPSLEQEFWQNHRLHWIRITRHYSVHMMLIYNLYIITLTFGSAWYMQDFIFDPVLFAANYIFGLSTFLIIGLVCWVSRYNRYYNFAMMLVGYLAMTIASVVAFMEQPVKSSWQASFDCFFTFIFFFFLCGIRNHYLYAIALCASLSSWLILEILGGAYDTWLFFCVTVLSSTVLFLMSLLARSKDRIAFVQKKIVQIEQEINLELQQQLRQLSEQDPLTQLGNRRAFDEQVHVLLGQTREEGQHLTLLFIDIDDFKAYNDHYGHPAGDAALKKVAALVKANLGPDDICFRIGGEEFVVLLPYTQIDQGMLIAERLRRCVVESQIAHAQSQVGAYLTLSIGVASSEKHYDIVPAQLLKQADEALYEAKANGRNRVVAKRNTAYTAEAFIEL